MLLGILTATMLFGMTVCAGGSNTDIFDFGETQLTIETGGSASISLRAEYDYSCYVVGAKSKETYAVISGKSGSQTISFHIGSDETAKSVAFWFYVDDHSGLNDYVSVDIKQSSASGLGSRGIADGTGLTQAAVTFPDATTGTVVLTGNSNVCAVSDAAGSVLAAFGVADSSGSLLQLQLGNTVSVGGISYLTVNTGTGTTAASIAIQSTDRQQLVVRGIAGLYLNGKYVLWP